jgi:heat shock protein HspQ
VEWVQGHNNNLGNELVDKAATDAVQQNTAPWYTELHTQTNIPYITQCDSQQLEVDLWQFLKQQMTICHHNTWTSQRRVKRAIGDLEDMDWWSVLLIIYNK